MDFAVPVLAALAGAFVYGVTGVLQQRVASTVDGSTADQAGLIRGLIRRPAWLLSTVGSVVGFGLQGLALGTGPIVLVQPVLVTGILFAGVTGFVVNRRPVDWPFLGSLALTCAGLALFLVMARPTTGRGELTVGDALPLAVGLLVLLAASVALGLRTSGLARSLSFALAAGLVYGATAAVAKITIGEFPHGVVAVVTHWSLWALVVLGPLGFLLNQNAFREGRLASPALAVITVVDPLVGIAIGLFWLGERIGTGVPAIVGEIVGLAAMGAGVWLVAHRAPHVAGQAPEGSSDSRDRSAADRGGDGTAVREAERRRGRTAATRRS